MRKVPTLSYPLYIDDDAAVTLRTPVEVARSQSIICALLTYSTVRLERDHRGHHGVFSPR